jgi:hypothetical protein
MRSLLVIRKCLAHTLGSAFLADDTGRGGWRVEDAFLLALAAVPTAARSYEKDPNVISNILSLFLFSLGVCEYSERRVRCSTHLCGPCVAWSQRHPGSRAWVASYFPEPESPVLAPKPMSIGRMFRVAFERIDDAMAMNSGRTSRVMVLLTKSRFVRPKLRTKHEIRKPALPCEPMYSLITPVSQ